MSSISLLKNIESANLDNLTYGIGEHELDEKIVEVIKNSFKFDKFTPVQAATIPLILNKKDVIVEAKTGSGKTLAFIVPLLQNIIKDDETCPMNPFATLALILSPTRELAKQIFDELYTFAKLDLLRNRNNENKRLKVALTVGGKKQSNDISKLEKYGANIIVATPGRLSEILERPNNKLIDNLRVNTKYLILDEADHLLSVGFERSMSVIFSYLPKQRRTFLFSATQTNETEQLTKCGLRNPFKVNLNFIEKETMQFDEEKRCLNMPDKLTNYYQFWDTYAQKLASLLNTINDGFYTKIVVFFSTCAQVDYFEYFLKDEIKDKKVPIFKLHRKLKDKRKAIFKALKTKKRYVFLVTDILCRGIDIPDLHCVIHLDLPQSPEAYVHRSGRSGHQVNMSGISLLMAQKHEFEFVEYCRRKQINLNPFKYKNKETTIEKIKAHALKLESSMKQKTNTDTKLSILGLQAFVSYVRFYSSKLCLRQLLFPKLDTKSLVCSFGLTKTPQMPELKNVIRRRKKTNKRVEEKV